jgi:hypothetical protein
MKESWLITMVVAPLLLATLTVASGAGVSGVEGGIFWRNVVVALVALAIQAICLGFFRRFSLNRVHSLAVLIFSFSATGLLFFVDSDTTRYGLAILLPIALWFAERGSLRGDSAIPIEHAATSAFPFVSAFLFFAVSTAMQINFSIPQWLFAIGFATIAGSIAADALSASKSVRFQSILLYGIIIGVIFFQIAWLAFFWPFGYLTIAAVGISVFYALVDMFTSAMEGTLDTRRFVSNAVIASILSAIVLLSTPWQMMG